MPCFGSRRDGILHKVIFNIHHRVGYLGGDFFRYTQALYTYGGGTRRYGTVYLKIRSDVPGYMYRLPIAIDRAI